MSAKKRAVLSVMLLTLSLATSGAQAGIVIAGTRVIYPAQDREVSIRLTNEGDDPALVQVWLDKGNPKEMPDEVQVPFVLSPPLFRLDPKKGQTLRLVYTQEKLPRDRESVFWLNVLEVPPRAQTNSTSNPLNTLQFAFRSRIKVFFRPAGLSGNSADAAAKVTWKFVRKNTDSYALEVMNPTPYYVTFSKIKIVASDGTRTWENDEGGMIAPNATMDFSGSFKIPDNNKFQRVNYTFINDYGAGTVGQYEINEK